MTPEEAVINSSQLTKFWKLRLKDIDLLNLLKNKIVTIAVEKGIIRSKSIIVDATHTLSRSKPFSATEVLSYKIFRKTVYSLDDKFKDCMLEKNRDNELEKELSFCKALEDQIKDEPSICSIRQQMKN